MSNCFLIVSIFFALCSSAFATGPDKWPKIETDQDMVKFLQYVEVQVPNLFDGMLEYDTDLFQTLRTQSTVMQAVNKDPYFSTWLAQEPKRNNIDIEIHETKKPQPQQEFDHQAIEKLKATISEGLALVGPTSDVSAKLHQLISSKMSIYPEMQAKNLAACLVFGLSPELDKRLVFPLPLQEKIQVFNEHLDNAGMLTVTQRSEKTSKALFALLNEKGIEPKDYPSAAAKIYQEVVERDSTLEKLLTLSLWGPVSDAAASSEALHEKLAAFRSKDAAEFGDSVQVSEKLMSSLSPWMENAVGIDRAQVVREAKDLVSANTRAFSASAPVQDPPPLLKINLNQEPAWFAILSGCVGSDCSTKNLGPYNNSPSIHKYFIDRELKSIRGYVETGWVDVGGKRYLYVQTINGARVSGDQTEAILNGLYEARAELGVEGIMVPSPDQLGLNFNFKEGVDRVALLSEGAEIKKFTFPDAAFRRVLGQWAASDNYHSPDKVYEAAVYIPKTAPKVEIRVKVVPLQDEPLPELTLNRGKSLVLALELELIGKESLANRILKASEISVLEYRIAKNTFYNKAGLTTDNYLKKVTETLQAYDYEFDPKFKSTRIEPFFPGLIRASDAFSSTHLERTVTGTITLLKKGADPVGVAEVIKTHPELFKENERLKNYLLKLFQFEGAKQWGPAWRTARILGAAKFDIDWMPEVREFLAQQLYRDSYYHRKSAAGVFVELGTYYDHALPIAFGLARENTADTDLTELFKRANKKSPNSFEKAIVNGFYDQRDWVQLGAMHAFERTDVWNKSMKQAFIDLAHKGQAKSHEAWLLALRFLEEDANFCNNILVR